MNWPVEVTAPAICWCVPAGCGQEQANCSKPEKVDANIHVFDQSRPKQHAAIAIHVHDSRMMYCWTTGSSQLMAELGFFLRPTPFGFRQVVQHAVLHAA